MTTPLTFDQRFAAFYPPLRRAVAGTALSSVSAGTIVLRSVPASYAGRAPTPDSARTVFKGAAANYRWSGARPGGAGKGALYVSLHLDALSNELFHYAGQNASLPRQHPAGGVLATDALAATRTFRFKVQRALLIVDLSPNATTLQRLAADPGVVSAVQSTGFSSVRQACDAPTDYSFTRALAYALLDSFPAIDALKVTTARNEWPRLVGETAENLALFGADGAPIPYLEPLSETTYGKAPDGRLTQTVKRFP